ncbi:MAG TPA: SAF domain-containing protein [Nocardioidaceae bacterium]|nr:SAF domain-containing protein [Nocardioidaceae bacterium]
MTTKTSGATRHDQQRVRADRGIRSVSTAALASSRGVPSPPRRRRPALAALAVLLIVGGAVLAALLAIRVDERRPVLVVNRDIAAGTRITQGMLAQTSVASEGLSLIPADRAEVAIGTFARVTIARGQLLDEKMLTTAEPVAEGRAVVGVPLAAGRVPPALRDGDHVRLVRLSDGTEPAVPLATALVLDTSATKADSLSGGGGGSVGTLLVPEDAADAVVDAAGNDVLGVALLDRGVPVDEADLETLGPGGSGSSGGSGDSGSNGSGDSGGNAD